MRKLVLQDVGDVLSSKSHRADALYKAAEVDDTMFFGLLRVGKKTDDKFNQAMDAVNDARGKNDWRSARR